MRRHNYLQAVLSHPLITTPPACVPQCYHNPWFITPPPWPLRPALYHPGYTSHHTPHRVQHPEIYIFLLRNAITRVCYLMPYTVIVRLEYSSRDPPIVRYPYIRRHTDIRRSKSPGSTGELHSQLGRNKAASPSKAVILLWYTTAYWRKPLLYHGTICLT